MSESDLGPTPHPWWRHPPPPAPHLSFIGPELLRQILRLDRERGRLPLWLRESLAARRHALLPDYTEIKFQIPLYPSVASPSPPAPRAAAPSRWWPAGGALLLVLLLMATALRLKVRWRDRTLFKCRRRQSEEWPSTNVMATAMMYTDEPTSTNDVEAFSSLPTEVTDPPPPYSEFKPHEPPPPPYSECYMPLATARMEEQKDQMAASRSCQIALDTDSCQNAHTTDSCQNAHDTNQSDSCQIVFQNGSAVQPENVTI